MGNLSGYYSPQQKMAGLEVYNNALKKLSQRVNAPKFISTNDMIRAMFITAIPINEDGRIVEDGAI